MPKIKLEQLSDTIIQELNIYHENIDKEIKSTISKQSSEFVKNTRRDAPRGKRQKFYKNITKKNLLNSPHSYTDLWYVKDPEYRLTHLIKNGHAKRNGGRTKANDFINKNYNDMEKKLETEIKEVIERGR